MALLEAAYHQASNFLNATAQNVISSSSNLALNMFRSILPLLIASISLTDADYLASRENACSSSSMVPDYFQTTPQILAGKDFLLCPQLLS
jgi:hypothetical protein